MVSRQQLADYLATLLDCDSVQDYCPNGLQVEGGAEVRRIVGGVTACQALLDVAVERGADAVLVHHGYFWRNEAPEVVGIKQRRIKTLLQADTSLFAYHLPLDAHPTLGNNAQLAQILGIADAGVSQGLVWRGSLPQPASLTELGRRVAQALGREPLLIAGGEHEVRSLAWCSGAAQGYIDTAADLGVDAYISGEVSEQTAHVARERGIHYIGAGHHATERYGVQALGRHLIEKYQIQFEFIDIDNPA